MAKLITGPTDIEGAQAENNRTCFFFQFLRHKFNQAVDILVPLCRQFSLHRHIVLPIGRIWNNIGRAVFVEQAVVMMPRSTFTFVITVLLAFAQIKSQADKEFPFKTHSLAVMVSVNCVVVYGFACLAEVVIAALGFDRTSVYAIIARLGGVVSLCILVVSLATLFYY